MPDFSLEAGAVDAGVFVSELEASWPLTGVQIREVLQSHSNRAVIVIIADQGAMVVKVDAALQPDIADADQLQVLDYLAERKFKHAPSLLRTNFGGRVARTSAGLTVVMEYLPDRLTVSADTGRE